jgi:hypothetical protein
MPLEIALLALHYLFLKQNSQYVNSGGERAEDLGLGNLSLKVSTLIPLIQSA